MGRPTSTDISDPYVFPIGLKAVWTRPIQKTPEWARMGIEWATNGPPNGPFSYTCEASKTRAREPPIKQPKTCFRLRARVCTCCVVCALCYKLLMVPFPLGLDELCHETLELCLNGHWRDFNRPQPQDTLKIRTYMCDDRFWLRHSSTALC